jgi:hypothetical protein
MLNMMIKVDFSDKEADMFFLSGFLVSNISLEVMVNLLPSQS